MKKEKKKLFNEIPKPPDRPQNPCTPSTPKLPGKNEWVRAHWRWDYNHHQWEWVLGHWRK